MKIGLGLSWKILIVILIVTAAIAFCNSSYTNPPCKETGHRKIYNEIVPKRAHITDRPQGVLVNSGVRG